MRKINNEPEVTKNGGFDCWGCETEFERLVAKQDYNPIKFFCRTCGCDVEMKYLYSFRKDLTLKIESAIRKAIKCDKSLTQAEIRQA